MVTLTGSGELDIGFKGKMFGQIGSRCHEVESGDRTIDAIVIDTTLPDNSGEFMRRMMTGVPVAKVGIDMSEGVFTYSFD